MRKPAKARSPAICRGVSRWQARNNWSNIFIKIFYFMTSKMSFIILFLLECIMLERRRIERVKTFLYLASRGRSHFPLKEHAGALLTYISIIVSWRCWFILRNFNDVHLPCRLLPSAITAVRATVLLCMNWPCSMPAGALNHGEDTKEASESKDISNYEEERRILLNRWEFFNVNSQCVTVLLHWHALRWKSNSRPLFYSVAQSLSQVVQKMSQVNESMNGKCRKNKEVEQVADLWRESFKNEQRGSESSLSLSQSRDLNFCVP